MVIPDDENRRVDAETAALESGRFDEFLPEVNGSGMPSLWTLQNTTPAGKDETSGVAVAPALWQTAQRQSGVLEGRLSG